MRVVFLRTNQTCRLSRAVERLHTVVLNKQPYYIHCGFEDNGIYVHATLDGVVEEQWRPAHERLCGYNYHIDSNTMQYWEVLHGIRLLSLANYTITYADWWSMLWHRPSHNCADFVARAMGLYNLATKFTMPDDLVTYLKTIDNTS